MVFAVRLDTFPAAAKSAVYYVGTNDTAELEDLRRRFLSHARNLPVSAEYIHRDAFRIAYQYGKDMVWAIRALGTSRLPWLFRVKDRVDLIGRRFGIETPLSDRLLQLAAGVLPQHLPRRLRTWHARFEHHLVLKLADAGIAEAESELARLFPSASGEAFLCTPQEADLAMLHRFAVAGAAVRYRAVHGDRAGPLVSLDVALRRDDRDWFEILPQHLEAQIAAKLYYGHFFCHVFHQDYLLHAGCDADRFEHELLALLDERGAEYPAEHNVGHLYPAKPALEAHYRALDPGNRLNAGVGQTSRRKNWLQGSTNG
jgi:D-lactate dehydrogenase